MAASNSRVERKLPKEADTGKYYESLRCLGTAAGNHRVLALVARDGIEPAPAFSGLQKKVFSTT